MIIPDVKETEVIEAKAKCIAKADTTSECPSDNSELFFRAFIRPPETAFGLTALWIMIIQNYPLGPL